MQKLSTAVWGQNVSTGARPPSWTRIPTEDSSVPVLLKQLDRWRDRYVFYRPVESDRHVVLLRNPSRPLNKATVLWKVTDSSSCSLESDRHFLKKDRPAWKWPSDSHVVCRRVRPVEKSDRRVVFLVTDRPTKSDRLVERERLVVFLE